jgi:hypothetical protein
MTAAVIPAGFPLYGAVDAILEILPEQALCAYTGQA